jgi:hypothetical protein
MKKILILFAAMLFIYSSCKKPGLGGDNTVVAFPQHHTKPIFSHPTWPGDPVNYCDTIFVKFNASELPGTKPKDYDRIFIGEAGEEHVHIHGLEKGKYFLYGVGWDTSINQRVTGGIAIELKQLTAETEIDVPVTE